MSAEAEIELPVNNLPESSRIIEHLDIDITSVCPLRCKYCYLETSPDFARGTMSIDVADQVVEYTARLHASHGHPVNWCLFGGEPFCSFEVVQYLVTQAEARGLPVNVSIFSNGATATPAQVAWCLSHKVAPKRSCGGCPEACAVTRPGDYLGRYHEESTLWNDFNRPRRVTVTPDTAHTLMQSLRYMYAQGYWGGVDFAQDDYAAWTDQQIQTLKDQLTRMAVEFVRQFHAGCTLWNEKLCNAARRMFGSRWRYQGCGAGCGLRAITWDGYVVPCHRFLREPRTSPFCGGTLADVLAGKAETFGKVLTDGIAANQQGTETDQCQACAARIACSHGCYHVSRVTAQDLAKSPKVRCEVAKHYAWLARCVNDKLSYLDPEWYDRPATRCMPIPENV